MKKVYFVQVSFPFGNSVYLPLAVGVLASNAWSNPQVKSEYELSDFLIFRDSIDDAAAKITEPFLVAFSNYVWNVEYNKALAKRIKQLYPQCLILFGGHAVPQDKDFLLREDYVDFLIFGEGEGPFLQLLLGLLDGGVSSVEALVYKKDGVPVQNAGSGCMKLDELPSPYLDGTFDALIKKHPDTDFLAVIETNRGCPNLCSFCDWCAGRRVRTFPLERVFAEIDKLSEHRIEYCFCADSNFGLLERDKEIVDYLVESKKRTGYPQIFRPCYAKDKEDAVFEICSKLNKSGMDKGATMAYQTLSPEALENINRKNFTLEHFASLTAKYYDAGITTYSELILGLPGETRNSFCSGLCRLLDAGQHNSISVYYCELLPNSEMAQPEYIKKHGIITRRVGFNHIHSAADEKDEIGEFSTLVVATKTMPHEDWVKSAMFSVCLQAFHNLGLLRFFAMYLRHEKNVEYLEFYSSLLEYIMAANGTKMCGIFREFSEKLTNSPNGDWHYQNPEFGKTTWFLEEGAFLELLFSYDGFMTDITPFLKGFSIESEIFRQLSDYQSFMLRRQWDNEKSAVFNYDFPAFFNSVYLGRPMPLERKSRTVRVKAEKQFASKEDFARETVWYGRRKGMTVYKPISE